MLSRVIPAGSTHVVRIITTDRADGDLDVRRDEAHLAATRETIRTGAWTWLQQVHGSEVVVVNGSGEMAGAAADAAVTASTDCVLAIHTADCVPVVIAGEGTLGVAHAGWQGIVDGVIPRVVDALDHLGGPPSVAFLGPCIRPGSYEFGPTDLDTVAAVAGDTVRSHTAEGKPALDVATAVRNMLSDLGVDETIDPLLDTANPAYFSHRVRADTGRQATIAWLEEL